ncbi:MAG: EAL domain-containing protein [Rhodocyclaceae bacterium]|nr:EAL domain-containing protein [Rhodocyclaceae bacterium]
MKQGSIRRKVLLLLAGTLTLAFALVAITLSWLINRQHHQQSAQTAHTLLRELGTRLTDQRTHLVANAHALARRGDIIATLALLTDYASPETDRATIYDSEKRKLATELRENVATLRIDALSVYDGNGLLVAFAGKKSSADGFISQVAGIGTHHEGKSYLLGTSATGADWTEIALPEGTPRQAQDFGLPDAPLGRELRSQQNHLTFEAIAPVLRPRGGENKRVGWVRIAYTFAPDDLNALARQRNMALDPLFSGNFAVDNRYGLKPEQFANSPDILDTGLELAKPEAPQHPQYYLDTAALTLAGNEQVWFVTALDRATAQNEQRNTLAVVLAVLVGSLLLTIPLANWAGRRWISTPFDNLSAGVQAYAQGELDTPIKLRTGDEFEAIATNINQMASALRLRESAIREEKERWQFALEGADHGVWDWNPQTREIFFSPMWKHMLGYADDEIANTLDAWRVLLHPADLLEVRKAVGRHFRGETNNYQTSYRVRAKDGSYRWVLAVGRVLKRDAAGQPLRLIGTNTDITEQRHAAEKLEQLMVELKNSEARYRGFFTESKAVMLLIDPADGRIIDANPAASNFYGYSHDEMLALRSVDINPLNHDEVTAEMLQAQQEGREHFIFPQRLKNGEFRTVEVYSGPYIHDGRLVLYSIIHDITGRVEAERAIREAATVFSATSEAIMITDAAGVIKRVNPAFTITTGYTAEEAVGQTPRLLKSGHQDADYYAAMWQQLLATGRWEGEVWNRRKNGEVYPEWQIISAVRDAAGVVVEYVSIFIDITQRKRSEAELAYRANYDALTGLPNRNLLAERLGQALKQARREDTLVAILFLDLDLFKQVNDTLGHAIGDRLLQSVAERLHHCVRETDTIARQGGDEFVVLLANIEDTVAAAAVADKIIARMAEPFAFDGNEVHIGASIGITLFPNDGDDIETLFRNADLAMYRAKNAGRNNAQFFTMAMTTAAVERRMLETDLRVALARREFVLHYQPIIDLGTGGIIGAEALLRWLHPQRGLVGPDNFIPLAEETGLIREIGTWVFAECCRQLVAWQAAGHQLTMAINVSVRQLPDALSVKHILSTLAQHELSPRQIVLEITEGVLLVDSPAIQEWFVAAGEAGLKLAIDDFGTGYSSLAYLKRFPVHHVKIDRGFVRDMASDPADRALVEAILAMARSLCLSVVAEGVETAEQADLLRLSACKYAQGYHFSRPLTAAAFNAQLVPPGPSNSLAGN